MDPQKTGSSATADGAKRRVLQYISDVLVGGPDDVYIDRWLLLSAGYDEGKTEEESQEVSGIAITTELEAPTALLTQLHVVDVDQARRELERSGAAPAERRSAFRYSEDWADWSKATEAADAALKDAPARDDANDLPATAALLMTRVQRRVLEYAARALESDAHWTAIDTWMMEQAALDARDGFAQTGEAPATAWHQNEAEFEIDGVWMRAEHRRSDHTPRGNADGRTLGLFGEFRILDLTRAHRIIIGRS